MATIDIHPSLYHSQGRIPPIFTRKQDIPLHIVLEKENAQRQLLRDVYEAETQEEMDMFIEVNRFPETNKY